MRTNLKEKYSLSKYREFYEGNETNYRKSQHNEINTNKSTIKVADYSLVLLMHFGQVYI